MLGRGFIAGGAMVALAMSVVGAQAHDESKYPDWSGQWLRNYGGLPRYDPSKPLRKQEAPLKPEYQVRFEASMADQDAGGHGLDTAYTCLPQGMPRMMSGVSRMEFLISPGTTHILFDEIWLGARRIYTDGRPWPKIDDPTFVGYSIGKWLDTDGDGKFDTLEVETRDFKGPRVYDDSGLPLHRDNQSVIKERLSLDKANRNVLLNEITTYDHALTRPWTVTKHYQRIPGKVEFHEDLCSEDNRHVYIGKEGYFLSGDGYLMPTKKDQAPPDLRYFQQTKK